MIQTIILQIESLSDSLKATKNNAASFFDQLLIEIKEKETFLNACNKIRSAFSISQYANFTYEQ